MKNFRIGSRYAKSFLDLAIERDMLETAFADMALIRLCCTENKDFVLMLKSPLIRTDKKTDILHEIFKGKINEVTMAFLDIITRKNREYYIAEIADSFVTKFRILKNIETAVLSSPSVLDAVSREKVFSLIRKVTDKKVEFKEVIDPSLIGGFILTVGDKEIDTSIKSEVEALRMEFSQNLFLKDY